MTAHTAKMDGHLEFISLSLSSLCMAQAEASWGVEEVAIFNDSKDVVQLIFVLIFLLPLKLSAVMAIQYCTYTGIEFLKLLRVSSRNFRLLHKIHKRACSQVPLR